MTFLHIAQNGLPIHALGDRRTDHGTAGKIRDALRARGRQAAARALAHQDIDMATALRVLAAPQRRREPVPSDLAPATDLPLRAGLFAPAD